MKQLPHPHFVAFLLPAFGRCPDYIPLYYMLLPLHFPTAAVPAAAAGLSSGVLTALLMLFYECASRFFFFFFCSFYFAFLLLFCNKMNLPLRIAAAIKWTKLSWKCFAENTSHPPRISHRRNFHFYIVLCRIKAAAAAPKPLGIQAAYSADNKCIYHAYAF